MLQISERIKQLREEKELKQEALAQELGCTRFNISYYENGREPPIDVLISYSKYFDVSLEYLLGMTVERKPRVSELEPKFQELETLANQNALTASDISELLDAMIRYYRAGAKAKDAPAEALRDILNSMTDLFIYASDSDVAAVLSAVNAVTRRTLDVTGILQVYLGNTIVS